MPVRDWQIIGLFGAAILGLSFVNPQYSWFLLMVIAAILLVRNADKLAAIVGKAQPS